VNREEEREVLYKLIELTNRMQELLSSFLIERQGTSDALESKHGSHRKEKRPGIPPEDRRPPDWGF